MVVPCKDVNNVRYLAVVTRRTYEILPGYACQAAPEQPPLVEELEHYKSVGQGGTPGPRNESDRLCALKPGTDLVIQGSAYSLRGPVRTMTVSAAVATRNGSLAVAERHARTLQVTGDRRAEYRPHLDRVEFTTPDAFEVMPVTYERAYGGKDVWSENSHPDEFADWFRHYSRVPREELSEYLYPRNGAGKGYLVHPTQAALEGVSLPNIERADDLLTPERLFTGHSEHWPRAPIPGGFDWVEQSWFPRSAFFCLVPQYQGSSDELWEVRAGVIPPELGVCGEEGFRRNFPPKHIDRFWHGATASLVFPTWTGHETVILTGMHPNHDRLEIALPSERPQMVIEPPGAPLVELTPALRTVLIQPDLARLTLVWAGRLAVDDVPSPSQIERVRHAVRWRMD